MEQTMKGYLFRLLNHEELSREEMKNILIGITQSEYPNEQITALLTCLQMRGVTVDELLGFRDGILETGVPAILNADRYMRPQEHVQHIDHSLLRHRRRRL